MKKKIFFLLIVGVLMLSGCSKVEKTLSDSAEKVMLQKSGVSKNPDYQKYQELKENNQLNDNNEYTGSTEEQQILENSAVMKDAEKQVYVTIADNSFLKINYFYDSALREKVEGTSVYLNPGEKLYCSQPESNHTYNNAYLFSEFQIYEYDSEKNRKLLDTKNGEENLVLEIPDDYKGTDLAVFPVGFYKTQILEFDAFYYDKNNNKVFALGEWSVNGEVCQDNTSEVAAGNAYTVKYQYDANNYYYVKAEPEPYSSIQTGVVEFRKEITGETKKYSVQLHQYITAAFSGDSEKGIASVFVNGDSQEFQNELPNLKAGDKLVVTTKDSYRIYCSGLSLEIPEEMEDGYRYTISIPETDKELDFKVSKSALKIVLDKSVGFDMEFDIIGAGINEENKYYTKQKSDAALIIVDKTIGLGDKLSIIVKNDNIENGYALKAEIKKTDGNSQKETEIQYLRSIPGNMDIYLYEEPEKLSNLDKIYKEISVKISVVPVLTFHSRTIENGVITVALSDQTNEETLAEGDIAETSRKIRINILPNEGYYVSGKNVKQFQYTDTMKLSEYEKKIEDIIKSHVIKKFYQVSLEQSDLYGECVYKLNGEKKEETVLYVREEDKLTLEYKLTDKNYKIVRKSGGFLGSIDDWRKNTFSGTEEIVTIPVSDGLLVKREDYIQIEKKGEKNE